MGVSLERVQNKFACIIGELCNEPLVLSQFAVWLDMRLAEYKAKGSIYLECGGDIPKPTWLKGLPLKESQSEDDSRWPPTDDTGQGFRGTGVPQHTTPRRMQNKNHNQSFRKSQQQTSISHSDIPQRRQDSHISHISPSHSLPSSPITSRPLSSETDIDLHAPTDFVVKQEVLEEGPDVPVVPVSMHSHEELQEMRKRTADSIPEASTSRKVQKVFDSSSEVSPLNEPLSSIISLNQDSSKEDLHGGAVSLEGMTIEKYDQSMEDDDIEILEDSFMQQSASGVDIAAMIAANSNDTETSRFSQADSIHLAEGSLNSSAGLRTRGQGKHFTDSSSPRVPSQGTGPGQEVPLSTVKMTITALKVFHRWMMLVFNDSRTIQQIQPEELDPILAKFFSSVLTQDGREYSAKSLKAFREGLERHLKNVGYPLSITHCKEFSQSQQAYRQKFQFLQSMQRAEKMQEAQAAASKNLHV